MSAIPTTYSPNRALDRMPEPSRFLRRSRLPYFPNGPSIYPMPPYCSSMGEGALVVNLDSNDNHDMYDSNGDSESFPPLGPLDVSLITKDNCNSCI